MEKANVKEENVKKENTNLSKEVEKKFRSLVLI